jgi:hypothetical protein
VQPEAQQTLTRDISIEPDEDTHTWSIGDQVRICAQADRDCHLAVVNIGASGKVTVLIPNTYHPETFVRAGQVVAVPAASDQFHFKLSGPPGPERLIAIASAAPLRLTPEDFDQSGQLICAKPTTRNIEIVADQLTAEVLGRCQIEFYVTAQEVVPVRTRGDVRGAPAEPASPFQSLDLG